MMPGESLAGARTNVVVHARVERSLVSVDPRNGGCPPFTRTLVQGHPLLVVVPIWKPQ